jgi:hypothetical protein
MPSFFLGRLKKHSGDFASLMISLAPDTGTLTSIDTHKDFRRRKLILGVIWVANLEKVWNSWTHMGAIPCF